MNNSKTSKYTYVQLTAITTILNLAMGLFVGAIFLFDITTSNNQLLCYILGSLIGLGLIYNLVLGIYPPKRMETSSKYLQLLIVMVEVLVVAYFTGGISSTWYLIFLMLAIGCSVLGFAAFLTNIALVSAIYTSTIVLSLSRGEEFSLHLALLPVTIAGLFVAGLVAYASDSYSDGGKKAQATSSGLSDINSSEKLILGSIADALVGINSSGKIILMNEAAQNLTGWDMHDALNFPCSEVLKLKDANGNELSGNIDPFAAVLASRQALRTNQYHILSKDNVRKDLSISIAPTFNGEAMVSGAIAVITDISQQKALERQRDEFVSTASHEMRTPVAAIEGYLAMASNPKLAQIDERARGFLDKAHTASIHLGKLFQDLLSVSIIEDKDMKHRNVVFNISDVVLKVSSQMQANATQKGLALTTHIGGAGIKNQTVIAPAYNVLADPEKLSEVLSNLIDNAIKYTSQGSVDIEIESDGKSVTVMVHDTGIGISAQEQKHLFEKFYRVNNSMTREQAGTGLGLYIARNLIELYGGKIWVKSSLGKGSTFAFKLPLIAR